jgi:hypothetical protein
MKDSGGVIKKADFLLGVRHWAQWYGMRKPRFEVFRYVGFQSNTGLYYFQSVSNGTIMARGFYQLNANGFVPFCLNYARSVQALEEQKNANV